MSDKELEECINKIEHNFDSHLETGTIEMSNEYYNLLEEKMARLINKNQELKKENKILRENSEHNDKVVGKVNWENQLLKKENKQLKDNWNKLKEIVKSQSSLKQKCHNESLWFEVDELLNKIQELEGDNNE